MTWDQEVQGKSACPVGLATKSPNFPNTKAQAETEHPKGISSPDAPSHPTSEERSLRDIVALGCLLKYMTEKNNFAIRRYPREGPWKFISSSDYSYLQDYIEDLTCELPSGHPNKEGSKRGHGRSRFVRSIKPHSPCPIRKDLLVVTEKPSRDVCRPREWMDQISTIQKPESKRY